MSSVFISYRRQDAATEAARIYSRLVKPFGRDGPRGTSLRFDCETQEPSEQRAWDRDAA